MEPGGEKNVSVGDFVVHFSCKWVKRKCLTFLSVAPDLHGPFTLLSTSLNSEALQDPTYTSFLSEPFADQLNPAQSIKKYRFLSHARGTSQMSP